MDRRDFIKGLITIPAVGLVSIRDGAAGESDKRFWDLVIKKVEDFQLNIYGDSFINHPAIIKASAIRYSQDFFDCCVAQAWGCTPSELRQISSGDMIDIYAWYIAKRQIEIVENYRQKMQQKKLASK